ncbi:polysaccharide biosynthesis/export family protein [Stenotrophomonas koreensis]|uniref:polysaccharide biosynthesis/export family protein n=1 Tax=Stenotrophomonas koreensis TaxID=266128 RepID=UPI003399642A
MLRTPRPGINHLSKKIQHAVLLAGTLFLCACSSAPSRDLATSLPEPDPVAALLGQPEYRIGPSDLLSVNVFQVPDLEREVRVNNAGTVGLPLVGEVTVAGRTVSELEQELAQLYGQRYLQSPQVSVFVKEFASQRITVGGEVDKPGIYPMTTSRLTLLQAIASAQGLSDVASRRNVFVLRNIQGQQHVARFDIDAIEQGQLQDPLLASEDIVIVDSSTGRTTLKTMVQLVPFLAVWRAYR